MTQANQDPATSAQGYLDDPRNENVLVYVNGEFVPRHAASVSVFDAGFVLGDGVWEGLRLVRGKLLHLDDHLDRLFEGAGAIRIDIGRTRDELKAALHETLARNAMTDGAHVRLMVTRGRKKTPNQDPRFVLGGPTIVIVAEFKAPNPAAKARGLALWTSTFRCSAPDVFDLRLNSHSRLNFIQALLQAIDAGADEALMLDPHGFVASCNSTNFFVVRARRAVDVDRPLQLQRHHAPERARPRPGERDARARARLHAGRNVFGQRGVRDRHVGRHHAGHADRRPRDRRRQTGFRHDADCRLVPGSDRAQ